MSNTWAGEAEHLFPIWLLIRWRSLGKALRRRDAHEACDPERIVRRGERLTRTISEITLTLQVAWLGLQMVSNSVAIGPALRSPPKGRRIGKAIVFLGMPGVLNARTPAPRSHECSTIICLWNRRKDT
jgi:hypothetical protein